MQSIRMRLRAVRGAGVGVFITAVWAAACADDATKEDAAKDADCRPESQRDDGTCCAKGSFYDFETDSCFPAGPIGCEDELATDPLACKPRWCPQYVRHDGTVCPEPAVSCVPIGGTCDVTAANRCFAGTFRNKPDGPCVPAGLSATVAPNPVTPAGVPFTGPLPALEDTRFCADGDDIRPCRPGEKGCAPGSMPKPGTKEATCIPVGVPWSCPPGFLPASAVDGIPMCAPDPADCGVETWNLEGVKGAVRYVDAAATKPGQGTKSAPFATITSAIAAASWNDTIAIAAGTYNEAIQLKKPVHLRGRCAAKTIIDGSKGFAAIEVLGGFAGTPVAIWGLTLTGSGRGLHVEGKASVSARRLYVHKATGIGLRSWGALTSLRVEQTVVRHPQQGPKYDGQGAIADEGANMTLRDVALLGPRAIGALVRNNGSWLHMERVLVAGTRHTQAGQPGVGVEAKWGGRFTGSSVRVSRSAAFGLHVSDPGSSAKLVGLVVDATGELNDQLGTGVRVQKNAKLNLVGARLHQNHVAGVDVNGAGVDVRAQGLIVDGTKPRGPIQPGGIRVGPGANAVIRGARIHRNTASGVLAYGPEAHLELHQSLVDETVANASNCAGCGVVITEGAHADVRDVRLSRNRASGLSVQRSKTTCTATNLLIDDTGAHPTEPHGPGYGIDVFLGGSLAIVGARITGHAWQASPSMAAVPSSEARASWSTVPTRPRPGITAPVCSWASAALCSPAAGRWSTTRPAA